MHLSINHSFLSLKKILIVDKKIGEFWNDWDKELELLLLVPFVGL